VDTTTTTTATSASTDRATEQLAPLLRAVATTALDAPVWEHLVAQARRTLSELIAQGAVPRHLAIETHDTPVVVVRTVAAAWKHVTAAPQRLAAAG
jgi:hypothetical protein